MKDVIRDTVARLIQIIDLVINPDSASMMWHSRGKNIEGCHLRHTNRLIEITGMSRNEIESLQNRYKKYCSKCFGEEERLILGLYLAIHR